MERRQKEQDERGPSARNLVLVFLASVAVCAVFFSLGFLIGYNQRESKPIPVSENVPAASEIPPPVNSTGQPSAASSKANSEADSSSAAEPQASSTQSAESKKTPVESVAPIKPERRRAASKKRPNRPPQAASSLRRPAPGFKTGYSVQVMAARTEKDARSLTALLKAKGYPAFVLTPQDDSSNGNYFRVLVGPYSNHTAALGILDKLEKEGFKPFIKH